MEDYSQIANMRTKAFDVKGNLVITVGVLEDLQQLQAQLKKVKAIGEKYSKATEYYDELAEGDFVKLPPVALKLVNQIGNEILQALKGDK